MGLYELMSQQQTPLYPVRNKNDVHRIVQRWGDGPGPFMDEEEEVDWEQLEQDVHALARIALQHLPD
jgi:hypothetical protein